MTPPTALSESDVLSLLAPLRRDRGIEVAVVALSGGPDSTALAGLAAGLNGLPNYANLHCATVDHGLRPESAEEASQAGAFAVSLGLSHSVLPWRGVKPSNTSQAIARAARYRLLAEFAERIGARHIVTAHTLDDQVETVLMRLVAGSGPSGLSAMSKDSVLEGCVILRPLLDVPKARLVATCEQRGWPYVSDPSNTVSRFARVRMRQAVPILAAEGLTAHRLATLAQRLRRADEALAGLATQRLVSARQAPRRYNALVLAEPPMELVVRSLLLALRESSGDGASRSIRLERVERLASDLAQAVRDGRSLRRTIAGLRVCLSGGAIRLDPEAPRRRGQLRQTGEISAVELGNGAWPP